MFIFFTYKMYFIQKQGTILIKVAISLKINHFILAEWSSNSLYTSYDM